jgi:hypothetical protein
MDPVPLENRIRLLACGLVVASGDVRIFVDQAVEDGFSADTPDDEVADGGLGERRIRRPGRVGRCPGTAGRNRNGVGACGVPELSHWS